jgi:hypothetical protein
LLRVLLVLVSVGAPLHAQEALQFSDGRWEFRGEATVVDTVSGRESLRMTTGTAYRRDVRLQDGTIDVDVMATRRRSFIYVAFRMENDEEYEEFYLRPHKSTLPDAAQYAPVYQGHSAWQLYRGPGATAGPAIEPGVWTKLRIVLAGRRAAIFYGDTASPILVIPRLARDPRPGYMALSAFLPPGTPGAGPIARFANVQVRPGVVAYAFGAPRPEPAPPSGVIRTWTVGEAFAAPDTALTSILRASLARTALVAADVRGLVELHRFVRLPAGLVSRPGQRPAAGVVARVRVIADTTGIRRFDLGFSDAATVFLNGRAIFYGNDAYDPLRGRDGIIGFDQATLYLPLAAGSNDLTVVVTDRFGGWGLMGRFPDARGLRVEPE